MFHAPCIVLLFKEEVEIDLTLCVTLALFAESEATPSRRFYFRKAVCFIYSIHISLADINVHISGY